MHARTHASASEVGLRIVLPTLALHGFLDVVARVQKAEDDDAS